MQLIQLPSIIQINIFKIDKINRTDGLKIY